MYLTTDRLVIRSLRAADAAHLADLWSDADVTRYMGGSRNHAEVFRNVLADAEQGDIDPVDALWPVIEKLSGHLVGHCGILKKEEDGKTESELIKATLAKRRGHYANSPHNTDRSRKCSVGWSR